MLSLDDLQMMRDKLKESRVTLYVELAHTTNETEREHVKSLLATNRRLLDRLTVIYDEEKERLNAAE